MGKRKRGARQRTMWVATTDLPTTAAHPFYDRLNRILDDAGFDAYVEAVCAPFYAATVGRPSLQPGRYCRLLLVGYFEGLDAERAIAWRAADSFALRDFLRLELPEGPPDHSTISRTRRLIDLETHQAVFTWIVQRLAEAGLVKGQTVGIDATTLEANAALRSIVRRDTGESYQAFLIKLAQASGIETPTRADLARIDRKRKKKGSITATRPWSTSKPSAFGATSRNRIVVGAIGRARPRRATPSTGIVGASARRAGNACCASAGNGSNGPSPISMKRVGCGACTCGVTTTSSNASCYTSLD